MPYTNAVPQANQTIASTTTPIRNNFAFIETDAQVEHSFNNNVAGQAEGTHIKASMADIVDPVALPTGTNGIYYVGSGEPKFYNGTDALFIQTAPTGAVQSYLTGTSLLTTSNTVLFTVPPNSCGNFYVIPPAGLTASNASCYGQFVSSATQVHARDISSPGLTPNSDTNLDVRMKVDGGSLAGNYTYMVVIYTP